jgi:hypothetical protein
VEVQRRVEVEAQAALGTGEPPGVVVILAAAVSVVVGFKDVLLEKPPVAEHLGTAVAWMTVVSPSEVVVRIHFSLEKSPK